MMQGSEPTGLNGERYISGRIDFPAGACHSKLCMQELSAESSHRDACGDGQMGTMPRIQPYRRAACF